MDIKSLPTDQLVAMASILELAFKQTGNTVQLSRAFDGMGTLKTSVNDSGLSDVQRAFTALSAGIGLAAADNEPPVQESEPSETPQPGQSIAESTEEALQMMALMMEKRLALAERDLADKIMRG